MRRLRIGSFIRIYTICHSGLDFRLKPLFAVVSTSKFKDGRVHFRDSGMKELNKLFLPEWSRRNPASILHKSTAGR